MNAVSFVPSKDNAVSEIWYIYDVFKMMQLSNWTKNILNIKNIQHKYLAIPINPNICMEGVHVKDPRKPWEKEWCFWTRPSRHLTIIFCCQLKISVT